MDIRIWLVWLSVGVNEFWGALDALLYALLLFMLADWITGVLCGISSGNLSSDIGFKGICRKMYMLILIGMAHILDAHILGTGDMLRTAAIFFYLSNEGLSIMENAARIGIVGFLLGLKKSFLTVKQALTVRLYDKNQQRKGGESP